MLEKKLYEAMLDQITFEFYSAHVYLAMSAYCYQLDLDGFANFFKVQATEEQDHGMKFFDFLNTVDMPVVMKGFDTPKSTYENIITMIEYALAHEKTVTKRIYHLMDLAIESKEHATISFLKWFIDEQVEEEGNFKRILQKLKRSKNEVAILYKIDDEMAGRLPNA